MGAARVVMQCHGGFARRNNISLTFVKNDGIHSSIPKGQRVSHNTMVTVLAQLVAQHRLDATLPQLKLIRATGRAHRAARATGEIERLTGDAKGYKVSGREAAPLCDVHDENRAAREVSCESEGRSER